MRWGVVWLFGDGFGDGFGFGLGWACHRSLRAFPSQISSIRLRKASWAKSTKRALAAHVISFTCNSTCLLPQVNENDKAHWQSSEMRCSEQGQISCFEASRRRAGPAVCPSSPQPPLPRWLF